MMVANQAQPFNFVPMTASSLLQEPSQNAGSLIADMEFNTITLLPETTSELYSISNTEDPHSHSLLSQAHTTISTSPPMRLHLPNDNDFGDQRRESVNRLESPTTTTQRDIEGLDIDDPNGPLLRCPQCDKEFSKPYSLKSHMVVHSGIKPHSCEECGHFCSQTRFAATSSILYYLLLDPPTLVIHSPDGARIDTQESGPAITDHAASVSRRTSEESLLVARNGGHLVLAGGLGIYTVLWDIL
ncbi:hypothetical protein BSLG_005033 [Batrachochytrium salamandrivorans]|nr:hypothetical protein BSLG_005033 [Batrachochytrium salamandrivorans]